MDQKLNRLTNMVDAVGATVYAYIAAGQLWTEDLPPPKPGFGKQAAHVSATP
jgi:hypothetical protein